MKACMGVLMVSRNQAMYAGVILHVRGQSLYTCGARSTHMDVMVSLFSFQAFQGAPKI